VACPESPGPPDGILEPEVGSRKLRDGEKEESSDSHSGGC